MVDGRKIQWFCTVAQVKDAEIEYTASSGLGDDLPIKLAAKPHFTAFKESCNRHADCTGPKQKCTKLYWEATKDSASGVKDAYFSMGSACYSWDYNICPSTAPFATENKNYNGTIWSYYNQF